MKGLRMFEGKQVRVFADGEVYEGEAYTGTNCIAVGNESFWDYQIDWIEEIEDVDGMKIDVNWSRR